MNYIIVITYLAVIAASASGSVAAYVKKINFMGAILIGALTAFGGGTVRDLLLDRYPIYWIDDGKWILISAITTIVVIFGIPLFKSKLVQNSIAVFDALGMATFSVIGSHYAYELGYNLFICAILGMMTGVVGGLLRDIICNRVPLVLKGELYILPAYLTGLLYLIFYRYTDFLKIADELIAIGFGFIFRLLAIIFDLKIGSNIVRLFLIKRKRQPQPEDADKDEQARQVT